MIKTTVEQEVLALCKNLIAAQSYSGEEAAVVQVIKQYAEQEVFDDIVIDEYGSILLIINGTLPGPTILFDGHIDTVPVREEQWTVPPFEGIVKDGKLYGRGTSDMKGAVAATIVGACLFAEKTKKQFPGRIVVSCSVQEELFEGVATRIISKRFQPDVVVIVEATNLNINRGQRGRAEIVIEVFGKNAHAANPEKGINAVYKMNKLLTKLQQLEVPSHPVLQKAVLELTDIKSFPYPGSSVVPSLCRATFDRRTLVGETKASILAPIEQLIAELKAEDQAFDAKVSFANAENACYTGEVIGGERFYPAWLYEDDEAFVQAPLKALQQQGFSSQLSHYSFCTNGSHFAGEEGIPTIGFGPSYEHLAHIDDEYIEVEQLVKATEGYVIVMESLTKLTKY